MKKECSTPLCCEPYGHSGRCTPANRGYTIKAVPEGGTVPSCSAPTWNGALDALSSLVQTYDLTEAVIEEDGKVAARLTIYEPSE